LALVGKNGLRKLSGGFTKEIGRSGHPVIGSSGHQNNKKLPRINADRRGPGKDCQNCQTSPKIENGKNLSPQIALINADKEGKACGRVRAGSWPLSQDVRSNPKKLYCTKPAQ
jgi:hypothetical protein